MKLQAGISTHPCICRWRSVRTSWCLQKLTTRLPVETRGPTDNLPPMGELCRSYLCQYRCAPRTTSPIKPWSIDWRGTRTVYLASATQVSACSQRGTQTEGFFQVTAEAS